MNSLQLSIVATPVRIEVPCFIRYYCKNRFTETLEFLDERDLAKAFKRYSLTRITSSRVSTIKKNDPVFADIDSPYFYEGENVEHFILVGRQDGLTKVLVKYPVLPLTVKKVEVLKRAAELEFATYSTNYPISLQEARYTLVDEFPYTNKSFTPHLPWLNPESAINLIRETKGCFKLSLNETGILAEQRREDALRRMPKK